MRLLTSAVFATAMIAGAQGASAADPIGKTISVVNLVTAELSTERRDLAIGDGVRQNELVEAAKDARSEFKLNDDSKLALGPGAKLVLDKFIYDANSKAGSIAVRMTTGAFRWVTGQAEKKAYTISIPSASITVRGTIFDTYVQQSGSTWILLHEGAIQACNTRGKCRVLDEPGQLLVINQDGDIGVPFRWASLKGAAPFNFDDAFPFVVKPPSFESAPVLTRDAILTEPVKSKPIRKAEAKPEKTQKPATKVAKTKESKPSVTPIKVVKVKPVKPVKVVNVETVKPIKVVETPKRPKRPVIAVVDAPPVKVTKPVKIKPPVTDDDDDDDRPVRSTEGKKWKDYGLEIASRYTTKVKKPKTQDDSSQNDGPPPSIGLRGPMRHVPRHPGSGHNPG